MSIQETAACPNPGPKVGIGSGRIEVKDVTYSIRSREGAVVDLVSDCSFLAERGVLTVLIGPSGCGKTTLMNLVAGYVAPSSGEILLDGMEVQSPSWDRLMVFQETALFPWMTTLDNVIYGPMVRRIKPLDQIRGEAAALLERFGLGAFKKHYPHQLSGGMQRRGELARALINDPLVLLMDEPFRGLDAMTRQLMQEYLARLFEETRTTTIFVTSEVDEAIFLADRIIVLSQAPAHVAETLEVPLPRPRDLSMFSSTAFAEIKSRILNVLYEEAAAALKGNAMMPDFKEAFERRHAN